MSETFRKCLEHFVRVALQERLKYALERETVVKLKKRIKELEGKIDDLEDGQYDGGQTVVKKEPSKRGEPNEKKEGDVEKLKDENKKLTMNLATCREYVEQLTTIPTWDEDVDKNILDDIPKKVKDVFTAMQRQNSAYKDLLSGKDVIHDSECTQMSSELEKINKEYADYKETSETYIGTIHKTLLNQENTFQSVGSDCFQELLHSRQIERDYLHLLEELRK